MNLLYFSAIIGAISTRRISPKSRIYNTKKRRTNNIDFLFNMLISFTIGCGIGVLAILITLIIEIFK